jgi:hypothetical protein
MPLIGETKEIRNFPGEKTYIASQKEEGGLSEVGRVELCRNSSRGKYPKIQPKHRGLQIGCFLGEKWHCEGRELRDYKEGEGPPLCK